MTNMPVFRPKKTSKRRTRPRLTVSERLRLGGAPMRYYKRGGKTMARCHYCKTLVQGGMRGMMKHAKVCKEWDESVRLANDTPEEVQQEVRRLNRALAQCRKRPRS